MNLEINHIEYKEKITHDLEKEVVAFLNSKGGDIYIGIKNNGSVIGVKNPDEIQLKIKDKFKYRCRFSMKHKRKV
jgi:predicted HTH transcriptional regulator